MNLLKALAIIACIIFSSCTQREYKDTFVISGTYVKVVSSHKDAAKIVHDEFRRLDKIFNPYLSDSEISRLNQGVDIPVKVSGELCELILLAKAAWEKTGGFFDASQGALYQAWKDVIKKKRNFLSEGEVASLCVQGGMTHLVVNEKDRIAMITKKGVRLDLSGIAKGFMVDKAKEKLQARGINNALIDAGGDIYCLGTHRGNPWTVGIQNPLKKYDTLYPLKLTNRAAATSGNYEQFFEYQGRRYSHLVNPKTGYPVSGEVLSVTVVGDEAAIADYCATALYIMGLKGIKDFMTRDKFAGKSAIEVFAVTKQKETMHIHAFQ